MSILEKSLWFTLFGFISILAIGIVVGYFVIGVYGVLGYYDRFPHDCQVTSCTNRIFYYEGNNINITYIKYKYTFEEEGKIKEISDSYYNLTVSSCEDIREVMTCFYHPEGNHNDGPASNTC